MAISSVKGAGVGVRIGVSVGVGMGVYVGISFPQAVPIKVKKNGSRISFLFSISMVIHK